MSLNNPNLYGYQPQHKSIRGTFKDYETDFVKSWSAKPGGVKEVKIYGRSDTPIGRTQGKKDDAEFTCTLYYAGWNDLRDYLISQTPTKKLSNAIIDISLLVTAADGVKKIDVKAARVLDYEFKSDEGENPIEVEIKWGVATVVENGCPLI